MEDNYLQSVKEQLAYYKSLGDRTFRDLSFEQCQSLPTSESNSIAIIVKHLWGNMLSRWTNFLNSDGEKDWRKRDEEFIDSLNSKDEIVNLWEEGWACVFNALETINSSNIQNTVNIRGQKHSVVEAINRQLAHYAYHVGQIVFIAKMLQNDQWKSLTIPKNKSAEFNTQMLSKSSDSDSLQ